MLLRYQYLVVKYNDQAQWLSWLERRPVTAEVTGSSPVWVVDPKGSLFIEKIRGLSSAGLNSFTSALIREIFTPFS